MLNRLLNHKKRDSGAASLAWYILMTPVFFALFAAAAGFAMAQYQVNTMQHDLDTATQSALSLANNPSASADNGLPIVAGTNAQIRQAVADLYDKNRSGQGNMNNFVCQGTQTAWEGGATAYHVVPGSTGCGFAITYFTFTKGTKANPQNTIKIEIVDVGRPVFLNFLGIPQLAYRLSSTATLTNTYNPNN